jgi:hypothetical protein
MLRSSPLARCEDMPAMRCMHAFTLLLAAGSVCKQPSTVQVQAPRDDNRACARFNG